MSHPSLFEVVYETSFGMEPDPKTGKMLPVFHNIHEYYVADSIERVWEATALYRDPVMKEELPQRLLSVKEVLTSVVVLK